MSAKIRGIGFGVLLLLCLAQPAYCFDRFLDQQLYTAAENGTGWLVKILLLVGANPNAKHITEGTTPLMGAANAGQTEIVKLFLDKGADPKITDKNGATALTMGYHHLEIVKLLVDKGADVNAQPVMGGHKQLTALMAATADGDKETVAYLLEHGADPTMKALASEKTALDMAEQHHQAEISKMLSDMIAKKTGAAPGATPDAAAAAASGAVPAAPGTAPAPGTPPAPGAPAQAAATPPPGGAAPASTTPPPAAQAAAAATAPPAAAPPAAAPPAAAAPATAQTVPPASAPPAAPAAPAAPAPASTH